MQPKGRTGRKSGTGEIARLEKSEEPPAQPPLERAGGGVRSFPETGQCPIEGTGRSAEMRAQANRTADPAVRARRFGALGGGAPSNRESESDPGERAPGRGAKLLRDRWVVGPPLLAYAGKVDWQTCPAAKASRTTEASAIGCASIAIRDRRRSGFAKAETSSIRRRRGAIPGGCAATGNGSASASPQRWAKPGSNPGNGVGIKDVRADSGLRRNCSPKTRKGRERNLEPG